MLFGKVRASWKTWGLFVIWVRAIYKAALKTNTPMIIPKLNEKIIMSKEAMMDIIITAKRERGSPKITALFLMFL
jgi:hypothetical protein